MIASQKMISLDSSAARAAAETTLLQFLCDAHRDLAARRQILGMLGNYSWRTHDNTIFFECIRELLARVPRQIVAQLPAALTRRGFPDMPCEFLTPPSELTAAAALALAEHLLHRKK
ncbi:MAG TPA: hypothetical protein VKS20_07060 [Candidatus Acidoferrales bacterium]|nr:hypothetical protein [Candidatus Acidoferrales bacterium]